ncbi:hypothetical protein ACLOJK_002238 [Asimina triloba]
MDPNQKPRWEGRASVHVSGATPDQLWPFLQDFTGLHKWLPSLAVCRLAEGVPGQPGCVRYCTSASNDSDGTFTLWAKEKLLSIDPIRRSLSYEVIDSNLGFGWYVATVKVVEEEGRGGCVMEWSFVSDPVEGWSLEGLISYIDASLKAMAERMQEALRAHAAK